MPNLSKTGNATHDANCQAALLIWQNAMASATTQAQATAADIVFTRLFATLRTITDFRAPNL
jgi:hypothetical protein